MSAVELNDVLFAKLAGWEAVKQARTLLAADRVLSSEWEPPTLKGTVQEGTSTYRAGLVIRSASDADNLCPCRQSRQRGLICAHSVAIGLHYLKSLAPAPAAPEKKPIKSEPAKPAQRANAKAIRRAAPGETGEPLEIFIILPPNFAEAATKGRVMVYLEGKWSNGRVPLNVLPLTTPFSLSPQDSGLLDAVETLAEGDTPAMLMLNANQFTDLLPKLAGHPNITIGKAQSLEVSSDPVSLEIEASLEDNGEIIMRGRNANFTAQIRGPSTWILRGQTLRPLGLPTGMESLLGGTTRIPRSRVPQFLNLEWPRLVANCQVQSNFVLEDFVLEPATPRFKLHLAGGIAMLQGKLDCFYGDKPVSSLEADSLWLADPSSPTTYRTRNFMAEQEAVGRLLRNGFTGPDSKGLFHLNNQNQVLNFFAREYPTLEKEWEVTLEERLERSTENNLERIEPKFQVTASGEQWFDLSVTYDTRGGDRFAPAEVQRLLLSGQSHTRLKNGKYAIIDTGAVEELQEVLVDAGPEQHANGYRFANTQAGFLDATLRQQTGWKIQAPTAWTERAAQQRGEVKCEPPSLASLESVLRPYQKQGVAWLNFLRTNGFGGILADEMGLGKTLQVLALINALHQQKSLEGPVLVVCPTSLVFNWVAEAAKFTPQLRVLALHGSGRHALFTQIPKNDLIITSYALLRRDAEQYRELKFDTVILDEAQHIKNRQTQNAQAVKSIRTGHRLVLTGTPVENSVLDLWSIFDFLMPGYLGRDKDFKERYEVPIVKEKNVEVQNRLARRLRPFMLRRLKREVASDLPEKIEQVSYCDLTDDQRALYTQVLEASRREIVNAVDANGLAKSRMVVLTALLRLRQICCDLRLLESKLEDKPVESSGKVELFGELLEEVIDGGHRVLVFSQFTTMLGLLRERLAAENIDHCYLDGSTKNRAEVVEKFQRNPQIPVFLISLKAGGVGLNLTGADTVIHFDPWWNPAVEAQATDRAHRIGQKKVVTSYKLITRGTVEEKILNLQTRKRALFQGMLGGEEQLTEALNWEEIQDLLAS